MDRGISFIIFINSISGTATKTCHCHEGVWINGQKWMGAVPEPWLSLGVDIANAWGQFYRTGTFPSDTLLSYKEMNFDAINTIGETFSQCELKYSRFHH